MPRFPLRVGVVILPDVAWSTARSRWERSEALGFDHAWTYDHLTWQGHRERSWFAAVPTLAAAATVTQRIRLGPLVASPNFRHPLTLAKDLIALDDITDGRAILGVGAGGTGWDATMLGQQPWSAKERAARFEELVALTDRLLREPRVSASGRYYSVDEARTIPGCRQRPRLPIAVAATGARAMAVAVAHGDTWVTTGPRTTVSATEGVRAVREQIERLDRVCVDAGRDPASLDRLVLTGIPLASGLESPDAFADTAGRYAALGVTDLVVHWPREDEPYAGSEAVFEQIFG